MKLTLSRLLKPKQVEVNQKELDQQLIDEIHNEFDTAPQRMLDLAKLKIEQEFGSKLVLESGIEDKATRLEKLGFVKNGLVAKKQQIEQRIIEKDRIISLELDQAERIDYYSITYPFLKFLPESELDRICDKYGLIYAPIDRYKMPVPDKNLAEIEDAQSLKGLDVEGNKITWEFTTEFATEFATESKSKIDALKKIVGLLGKSIFTEIEIEDLYRKYGVNFNVYTRDYACANLFYKISSALIGKTLICVGIKREENRQGLFIAAPKHHFDLEGLEFDDKKGYFQVTKTVVKDPVVFRYVKGGIQVLTKWGLEGEDPALQMEILN